eukprot:tig00001532_g9280.t1
MQLAELLGWKEDAPKAGARVLVKDCVSADGRFLVVQLLALYLRAGFHAVVVAFEETQEHYAAVSKKLGTSLAPYLASKQLEVLDALSCPYAWAGPAPAGRTNLLSPGGAGAASVGEALVREVRQRVQRAEAASFATVAPGAAGERRSVVVLDGVSTLAAACGSDAEAADALQYLWAMSGAPHDAVLEVAGLASGFSQDVHGQLRLWLRPAPGPAPRRLAARLHFALADSAVRFFPSGAA